MPMLSNGLHTSCQLSLHEQSGHDFGLLRGSNKRLRFAPVSKRTIGTQVPSRTLDTSAPEQQEPLVTPSSLRANSQVALPYGCWHGRQSRTVEGVLVVASSCSELNVKHMQSDSVTEATCKDARMPTNGWLTQPGAKATRQSQEASTKTVSFLPFSGDARNHRKVLDGTVEQHGTWSDGAGKQSL